MSGPEDVFRNYGEQLRDNSWREIEHELIDYLASHRVDIINICGEPHFEAVIFREGDEVTARKLSIERLTKHLSELP